MENLQAGAGAADQQAREQREGVRIEAYGAQFQPVFKALNLETNRRLEPAITLYRKLSFQEMAAQHSPYQRADVFMRLVL